MTGEDKPILCKLNNILFRIDKKTDGKVGIRPASELVQEINASDSGYEIHFHCPKHEGYEVYLSEQEEEWPDITKVYYNCPVCGKKLLRKNTTIDEIEQSAVSVFNSELFKNIKPIRVDDFYIPEAKIEINKNKVQLTSRDGLPDGYRVIVDIKKDKDSDTMVMLQIFRTGENKGAQLFIKPEKGQLTSDHTNPDPAKFISEISVKLKNKSIFHRFK